MAARFAVSTGVIAGAFAWNGTAGLKWALTSGGAGGQAVPGTADDVTFDSATSSTSYTATRSVTTNVRSVSLAAPSSGTLTFVNASAMALGVGGLTIAASGVDVTGWTGTITINVANTLNTNGATLGAPLSLSSGGSNVGLGSNFTSTKAVTVTLGTLNLNGKVLTCASLTSASGQTVNFGTGGSVVVNTASGGSFSLDLSGTTTNPGPVTVNAGTFSTLVGPGSAGIALTLTSSSSAATVTLQAGKVSSLTLTGFTGTVNVNGSLIVASSLTLPTSLGGGSGGWTGTGALTVQGTLTTNGRTIGGNLSSLTPNNANLVLGSNVTVAGTLDFQDTSSIAVGAYTLTVDRINFTTTDVNYPSVTMSGGRIVVTGSGVSAVGAATFGVNSIVEFTTAASRTLAGNGSAFPNLTIINSAGTLTITQGITVGTISASTGVIQIESGRTLTVSNVSLSNSTLRSATAGTPATISKASGTVNFTGMTFRDITATGGAVWNAYTSNGNVDGGGNTGINFSPTTTNSGNFFALLT